MEDLGKMNMDLASSGVLNNTLAGETVVGMYLKFSSSGDEEGLDSESRKYSRSKNNACFR